MLYDFFQYMDQNFNLIGAGVFQYISFRAGMAALFSLIISILFGKKIINILKQFQLSENIRDLDLKGQNEKKGWSYNYYFNFNTNFIICSIG